MENLISEEDAIQKLRALCEEAGGVGALADKIGVSISAVSQQLNGHKPIQGRIAQYMGIEIHRETTIHYKRSSA